MDNSIVPAHLAVKAMRDNGYKNAAYAVAELMDNSIQHGASMVELLCSEVSVQLTTKSVDRVNKIAVLDNGKGMDSSVLRMALQFGNGTNLDAANQKGIGKFGMGLPSSSISQAKTVEVWSWISGIENAIYSYLDIDQIINKEMNEVPEPVPRALPELWKQVGKSFDKTGTLVVWSNIDRCIWKTSNSIIDNSEFLVGRMYRKFILSERVKIRMTGFMESNPTRIKINKYALANDPIYLAKNTSCPEPFNDKPMFEKWGDDNGYEIEYKIQFNGGYHSVKLRFTVAKKEAREGHSPGSRPYGQHAKRNIGVSIVRSNRELDLDQSWVISYDPVERWWGIEIEFPPALDEIFGVTNNKQFANNFSDVGKMGVAEILKDKSLIELKDELEEEGDPKAFLVEIAQRIESSLSAIRGVLKAQTANQQRSNRNRHGNIGNAEKKATEATEERKKEGHEGTSDKQEKEKEEKERIDDVQRALEGDGIENASDVAKFLFNSNIKYYFEVADLESYAFFTTKSKGGKILISLNSSHPAYHKLVEVLDESTDGVEVNELRNRLSNASDGLKLLLMAWARYEDESADGNPKAQARDARMDWGRIARDFLDDE